MRKLTLLEAYMNSKERYDPESEYVTDPIRSAHYIDKDGLTYYLTFFANKTIKIQYPGRISYQRLGEGSFAANASEYNQIGDDFAETLKIHVGQLYQTKENS